MFKLSSASYLRIPFASSSSAYKLINYNLAR